MRSYLLGYLSMGSTHKTIYFPDLMDIRVPLPPTERQERAIQEVSEAADERKMLCSGLSQQVSRLIEYKQSLITAAVTGELDVTTVGSGIPG